MAWKLPFYLFFGVFTIVSGISSAQEMKDASTGQTFPATVSFEHEGRRFQLEGTGVATRKKFIVKVYSIASYIADPASVSGGDVFQKILDSKNPKQLTTIWVRSVDRKKVQDGYRESFGKTVTGDQLKNEIDQFLGFIEDVHNNDTHILRWTPDGTVTLTINGKEKGSITSEPFARALWSIWFGANSVVNRDQLVSKIQ